MHRGAAAAAGDHQASSTLVEWDGTTVRLPHEGHRDQGRGSAEETSINTVCYDACDCRRASAEPFKKGFISQRGNPSSSRRRNRNSESMSQIKFEVPSFIHATLFI